MCQDCLTLGPQTNALPSKYGAPLQYHCCGVLWVGFDSLPSQALFLRSPSLPKLTSPTQEGHVPLVFPKPDLFWPSICSSNTIGPGGIYFSTLGIQIRVLRNLAFSWKVSQMMVSSYAIINTIIVLFRFLRNVSFIPGWL